MGHIQHRVGRFPPSPLRFLSPANGGTEGGVKTIEERVGVRGGALFKGKEGRGDFRKISFFNGKEGFCPLRGEPKGS